MQQDHSRKIIKAFDEMFFVDNSEADFADKAAKVRKDQFYRSF